MREVTERAFVQSLGYLKNLHRVVFSKGLKLYPSEALEPGEVRVVEETPLTPYSHGVYLHPINYYYLRYVDDETVRDGFATASVMVDNWLRKEWEYQFHKMKIRIDGVIYFAGEAALRHIDEMTNESLRWQYVKDRRADLIIRRNGFDPNALRMQNLIRKQGMVVTDDGRSLGNQEEIYTRHIDYKSMYRFGIAAKQLGEAANVVAPMIRNMGDAIAYLNSQVKLPWYKRVFKRRK